jgi:hypothetical protein
VLQSPIEFALIGPQKSRDRVLVRSSNAGIDLIGLAGENDPFEDHSPVWPTGLFNLLWNNRQLNIVKSVPASDVGYEADTRQSKFRFVWTGLASVSHKKAIERALNLQLADLHRALKDENVEDIELALAPVIYSCARANERLLRARGLFLLVLVLYGVLLTFAAVIAAFVSLFGKGKL